MAERNTRTGRQGTSWTPGGRREDRYAVIDGRIWNNSCEIEVVHHCNLACRSCSHLSPLMHRELVEPKDIQHDLTVLSRHYRAASLRLVGGEPLLHPRLLDLVEAVRASGIAPRVHVFTNGTGLPRMGDEFWAAVDEVSQQRLLAVQRSDDVAPKCEPLVSQKP